MPCMQETWVFSQHCKKMKANNINSWSWRWLTWMADAYALHTENLISFLAPCVPLSTLEETPEHSEE